MSGLPSLPEQLIGLMAQRAGVQAELDAVKQQLKTETGPAASAVQVRASELGLQIAHLDGTIAAVRAQIKATQGGQVGTPETPPYIPPINPINPDLVFMGIIFTLAFPVVIALSIVFVRRFGRGRPRSDGTETGEALGRLERLEHAVDSIAVEVERISEGQRFVTKILSDQAPQGSAALADPARVREKSPRP